MVSDDVSAQPWSRAARWEVRAHDVDPEHAVAFHAAIEMKLEELTPGATVNGILPDGLVTVVSATWVGSSAVELTYKDGAGRLGHELVFRDKEATLEVATTGRPWSFDGDGAQFKLVAEAHRIRLAYLFDPLLAVHTSLVQPLPHQITAVYASMLPRQPLRFLLADDPGAGKPTVPRRFSFSIASARFHSWVTYSVTRL